MSLKFLKATPAHSLEKFVIRLPEGMREKIGVAARTNRRPMNAEIVSRLEASLSGMKDKEPDTSDMIISIYGAVIGMQTQIEELKALITAQAGDGGKKPT